MFLCVLVDIGQACTSLCAETDSGKPQNKLFPHLDRAFPGGASDEEPSYQDRRPKRCGFNL